MEPRTCLDKYKRILKKAGIDDYSFHALRHTFATRCMEMGFDIKSLSEILGHANVNITLQRYVHPGSGGWGMIKVQENIRRFLKVSSFKMRQHLHIFGIYWETGMSKRK